MVQYMSPYKLEFLMEPHNLEVCVFNVYSLSLHNSPYTIGTQRNPHKLVLYWLKITLSRFLLLFLRNRLGTEER